MRSPRPDHKTVPTPLFNRRRAVYSNRKAFTGVELLVVALVILVLTAIAIPVYLNALATMKKKTCLTNMANIAASVQTEHSRLRATSYSFAIGNAINTTNEPDLTTLPICPNSGTYTIADGGATPAGSSFKVVCTKDGNFIPGTTKP